MIAQLLDPSNYTFSIYAVPTFLTTVAILLLGLIVLVRERTSPVSLSFFLLTAMVSIWLFCFSWTYSSTNEQVAFTWTRLAYLGVLFIAPATYQFTASMLRLGRGYKRLARAGWVLAAIAVLGFMWLLGIPIELPNGSSRTLANSKPGYAYYTDMAISPAWDTMALGTLSEGVQVWGMKEGKMLYDTEPGRVGTVAISPEGDMLALFWKSEDESAHRVELRRMSDGELLRTMEEQEEWVSSVAFSPDGHMLAVGDNDKVQIFDVDNGKRLRTLTGAAWEVTFSPDGKQVAAGGMPIKVWRVEDGALLYTVEGWHFMVFTPDSKTLATVASVNNASITLWDTSTGALLHTLQPPPPGAGQIHSLAFSPDGELLAAGTNSNTVDLWRVGTHKLDRTLRLGTNNSGEDLAFSSDGGTLAVQMSYRVQLWDMEK